jgi:hypothetical protein
VPEPDVPQASTSTAPPPPPVARPSVDAMIGVLRRTFEESGMAETMSFAEFLQAVGTVATQQEGDQEQAGGSGSSSRQ